jgi:erythromycin esterase
VVVTAALLGIGTVWFDDLSVEAAGRTWDAVPAATPPDAATLEWLAERSTPFSSVDAPDSPRPDSFADLAALGRIVGDARVVALGEATHGTSEFFRVKHRLLAYLVEHAGFRVFAIEANQLAVEPINEYVRGASGDVRTLMRAMFRVWNTEEVKDLIEWMRAYNLEHPGRMVEFIGFDMQDPRAPIDSVSAFLGRVEPPLRSWADSLYAPYREAWREAFYPQGSAAVRQSWHANAVAVYERLRRNRDHWLANATGRADSVAVEWAVQNANVAKQAALSALTMDFGTRDSAMAENIRWALDRRPEGTRMVVWAHDGHISRAAHEWANYWSGGAMGGELSRHFGEAYRAFGLLTYAGSYSGAIGSDIIDTPLFPAPVGSLEEGLHRVGQRLGSSRLIVDIRSETGDPARSWLLEPRLIRMIGYAAEDFAFASPIAVGSQFDGVVFVDTTSPSRVFR